MWLDRLKQLTTKEKGGGNHRLFLFGCRLDD